MPSCPDLFRASTVRAALSIIPDAFVRRSVDGRVKPGHDDGMLSHPFLTRLTQSETSVSDWGQISQSPRAGPPLARAFP
ncbi:conserved protein of unknown function [Magnetospirillum sp. XM-1]|nr:conserved protein of unknown function [Magnetospirillum sp. XM-1]